MILTKLILSPDYKVALICLSEPRYFKSVCDFEVFFAGNINLFPGRPAEGSISIWRLPAPLCGWGVVRFPGCGRWVGGRPED